MKVVVVACAVVIACSSSPECPAPDPLVYTGDCRPGGLAALDIAGTWHMVGSASSGMGPLGGPDTVTTTAIDTVISISRDGCAAGFGSGSDLPAVDPSIAANDTALTHACDHMASGCLNGTSWWSICVRDWDGAVRYYAKASATSGMGTEYFREELDYLTH